MKKREIVKESKDFERILKNGKCKKNRSFIIYSIENNLKYNKYGISVGKKKGNAVTRNKYKRKLRAIIDNYKKSYENFEDYIIILRKEAVEQPYNILEKEFFALMTSKKKGQKDEIK